MTAGGVGVRSLKLHWSSTKPNFGDWLSPALCELLSGRPVEHASFARADLVAVGSLLQRAPGWSLRKVDVWGTGHIGERPAKRLRHRVHALRGPLSAEHVGRADVAAYGDPGLLVTELYGAAPKPGGARLGIVPHYKDRDAPFVAELHKAVAGSRVIDVFLPPAEVVEAIRGCDLVLSSSLHGLVVSDAYRIPNAWLQVSDRQRGGAFKYRDYYAALGVEDPQPFVPGTELPTLDTLARHIGDGDRPMLDAAKADLVASFPYPR